MAGTPQRDIICAAALFRRLCVNSFDCNVLAPRTSVGVIEHACCQSCARDPRNTRPPLRGLSMPKLRFPSGVPARRFRLFALAVLVYACTSEHSPTAPRGDESDPSFASAPAVTARPGGPYTAVEGSPISFDGTASSGTGLTYDWDFGDGTPHGTGATPTHVYVDNKKYNVRLVVTDASGRSSKAAQTTATIANAKPVVAALASPTPTPRANLSFSLGTTFTDAGTIDKHTGTFTWGDGGTSPATVTEANGSGSAS
jgi:hypothetical protein